MFGPVFRPFRVDFLSRFLTQGLRPGLWFSRAFGARLGEHGRL